MRLPGPASSIQNRTDAEQRHHSAGRRWKRYGGQRSRLNIRLRLSHNQLGLGNVLRGCRIIRVSGGILVGVHRQHTNIAYIQSVSFCPIDQRVDVGQMTAVQTNPPQVSETLLKSPWVIQIAACNSAAATVRL